MGRALDPTLILCFGGVTRQRRIQDRSTERSPHPPLKMFLGLCLYAQYALILVKLQYFQYVSMYMYFILYSRFKNIGLR